MDTIIGTGRSYSSRFMQQRRLLAFETPESTASRMNVISEVPLVLGARLSILDIMDHAGRYSHSASSAPLVCPKCELPDTTETLDHVLWVCPAHQSHRECLYDSIGIIWPQFTSSLRDISQKTFFLLGCNMPINLPHFINEDWSLRHKAMKAANAFLAAASVYPVKPTRHYHRF